MLYWLDDVEALPDWAVFIIAGTLWANAAVIPVALPGRYWSFAFIGALMLFLLLVAGMILASKFPFPESWVPAHYLPGYLESQAQVNSAAYVAILTGGCLGLLYGLLAGGRAAMAVGLALGVASGSVLGILSLQMFQPGHWDFFSALHFAWLGALAMLWLHLGAGLGAALGAPAAPPRVNPKSKTQNPKS